MADQIRDHRDRAGPGRGHVARLPLLLVLLGTVLLFGLLWLLPSEGSGALVVSNVATLGAASVALVLSLRAAQRCTGRDRIGMLLLAGSMLAFTIAEGAWYVQEVVRGLEMPYPSWVDGMYFVGYAFALATLLTYLPWRRRKVEILEQVFDAAIITGALFVIGWIFLIRGSFLTGTPGTLDEWISIGYPFLDVLILSLALLMYPRVRGRRRGALLLIASGFAVWTLGDLVFGYLQLVSTYASGGPFDAAWPLGYALVAIGAHAITESRAVPHRYGLGTPHRAAFLIPQIPVAAAALVGAYDYHTRGGLEPFIFVLGVFVFLSLVIRQSITTTYTFDVNHALNKMNQDLERRVEERTRELGSLNLNLRELSEMKTRFLNAVSHELRTPLTPVLLHTDLLLDSAEHPLDEVQRKRVQTIKNNLDRLETLIKQVTEVAMTQGQGLRLTPVDARMDELVEDEVRRFRELNPDRTIEVVDGSQGAALVHMDIRLVRRAFGHILDNALRFSPPGSVVTVRVTLVGAQAVVDVVDQGIGVDHEEISGLFEPFVHRRPMDANLGSGAGLGLFLSKAIIERHGGRIEIASEGPGHGTTVSLHLPLAEHDGTDPGAAESIRRGKEPTPEAPRPPAEGRPATPPYIKENFTT